VRPFTAGFGKRVKIVGFEMEILSSLLTVLIGFVPHLSYEGVVPSLF
jgi:hypothetical protein